MVKVCIRKQQNHLSELEPNQYSNRLTKCKKNSTQTKKKSCVYLE